MTYDKPMTYRLIMAVTPVSVDTGVFLLVLFHPGNKAGFPRLQGNNPEGNQMATKLSKTEFDRAKRLAQSAMSRARAMKEKAEGAVEQVTGAALTGGTAFLFSYAMHRFRGDDDAPGIEVLGVPLDLGASLGLHAMALFGVGGKYSDQMKHIANGALASYTTTLGAGLGTRAWSAERQARGSLPADSAAASSGMADRFRDLVRN